MTEIGPVNIQLTASGISEVLNAFKSVEDRCVALERKLDQVTQAGAKKRIKLAKDEATEKGRATDKEAKDHDKAEQEKTKATEKWAKQRERIVHNSAMMAGRLAKQQADEEIREAQRSANARMAFSRQLAGRIVSDFRSTLGHATRIFGAITALGGGLSIANSFSNELKISKSAMALEIASDVPGKPGQKINAADATAKARAMGIQYGVSAADVLETQHAIIAKTGRGAESGRLTEAAMKIGTAEGADPKELGQAVASAMAQNPHLTVDEGINLMKAMVDQGKIGAIEVKDLAKIIPVLTKTATLYGGSQSDNQARLVTMAQHAITTTGGPEQAAVAVARFGDWMSSKKGAKALGARGFNVFDKDGQLKPIDQLVSGVLQHGGNTAQGLGQMGMEGKAKSLIEAFQGTYNSALKAGKTHEEAANLALKSYREELTMRATDAKIESDLKKVQGTMAFQVAQNMEKLNTAIGMQLAPELVKLINAIASHSDEIAKVMKSIGEFIAWAVEHPWKAIAIAGAAAFAKAVMVEVLASGARKILASALGGAAGGGGGGGAGLLAGGGLATPTGAVVGTALATIGIGVQSAILTNAGTEDAANLAAKVRAFNEGRRDDRVLSPEAVQKQIDEAQKRLDKASSFEQAGNLILGLGGAGMESAQRDYAQYKRDQGLVQDEALKKAVAEAISNRAKSDQIAQQQKIKEDAQRAEEMKKALEPHGKNVGDNTAALRNLTSALNNVKIDGGGGGTTSGGTPPARDTKGNIHTPGGASGDF